MAIQVDHKANIFIITAAVLGLMVPAGAADNAARNYHFDTEGYGKRE